MGLRLRGLARFARRPGRGGVERGSNPLDELGAPEIGRDDVADEEVDRFLGPSSELLSFPTIAGYEDGVAETRRASPMSRRTLGSSSATRTVSVPASEPVGRRGRASMSRRAAVRGNRGLECRAVTRFRTDRDVTAELLDDAADGREAEAAAVGAGREKGLPEPVPHLVCHPEARVTHLETDVGARRGVCVVDGIWALDVAAADSDRRASTGNCPRGRPAVSPGDAGELQRDQQRMIAAPVAPDRVAGADYATRLQFRERATRAGMSTTRATEPSAMIVAPAMPTGRPTKVPSDLSTIS